MKVYAVIDTNVLVSALLTGRADSPTVKVLKAISEGTLIPLYNDEIMKEYDEVLHRPKFPFTERRIRPVLASIRAFGLHVNPSPTNEILPDMDDLVFYEVVMEKREDDAYLVTGNLRHFPPREYIVTPAEMMALIESKECPETMTDAELNAKLQHSYAQSPKGEGRPFEKVFDELEGKQG